MTTPFNNTPNERSLFTRIITQMIITGIVILVIIGVLMKFYIGGVRAAVDAKKQVELSGLYLVLADYYIGEGVAPINHSDQESCEIGKLYDDKKCLRELSRDGYGSPPISPNDEPYYYYNDDDIFYVATKLRKELPKDKQCKYKKDPHTWCKVYEK